MLRQIPGGADTYASVLQLAREHVNAGSQDQYRTSLLAAKLRAARQRMMKPYQKTSQKFLRCSSARAHWTFEVFCATALPDPAVLGS